LALDTTTENIIYKLLEISPNPIYYCAGEDMIIKVANAATLKVWGKDDSIIGLPFLKALPELEGQPFMQLLLDVYRTGITYYANRDPADLIINGKKQRSYFDFTYQAMKNEEGVIDGVVCFATDVTEIERARIQSDTDRKTLHNIVLQAPVGICIIKGDPFHVEVVNDSFLELIRKERSDFDHQSYWGAIPEAAALYEPVTRNVVETRKPYYALERELILLRKGVEETLFVNFVYEPIIDFDGSSDTILIVANEVTDQVLARKNLQRLNDELATAIEEESAANEELLAINEDMQVIQEKLNELNAELEEKVSLRTEELENLNEELISSNEELAASNEELASSNEELQQTQENLLDLNDSLEQRVLSRTKDLSESEERFRTMAEGSGILIAVGDEHGEANYFSQAWAELTGRSVVDLLENGWMDMIHPDDFSRYNDVYSATFRQQTPFKIEFRLLNKEGDYRWLLANGPPRFRSDGSFAGYICSCMDITELKKDEERKNDFIGMVSHELKTPLTSLKGYIQILQNKAKKTDDLFTSNALSTANNQVTKMTSMINGFLNISRLESGKILLDKRSFRLDTLIKDIISETSLIDSSHILNYNVTDDITVFADRDKIGNVISNLLSNAIKYSPNDKIIEVTCKLDNNLAQVTVRDSGMGIKQKDINQLFERYYRVDSNHTISGFGIGLYLSAEIIERHNGKIWVDSEFEKGSTFYFSIPLQ
jgi:PAS domain S-box-containing protein